MLMRRDAVCMERLCLHAECGTALGCTWLFMYLCRGRRVRHVRLALSLLGRLGCTGEASIWALGCLWSRGLRWSWLRGGGRGLYAQRILYNQQTGLANYARALVSTVDLLRQSPVSVMGYGSGSRMAMRQDGRCC